MTPANYEHSILPRYPKVRPPLPPAYQDIYTSHYTMNRDGNSTATGLAQRLERWMHHQVAKDVAGRVAPPTLEIGAGTLNHLRYEDPSHYDIVEPFTALYRDRPEQEKVRHTFDSVHHLPTTARYDRIISIATFEHILDLPQVVAQSALLLQPDGCLRVAIPAEGSWLWHMGWRLSTGIEFTLTHRLDYGILMRHEHVNNYHEIAATLEYFFATVKRTQLGLAAHTAFYHFYECHTPQRERASALLHL